MPFKHRAALERHFIGHGEDFAVKTADEYERLAEAFMRGPLRDGARECFKRTGELVRFDPRTAEFGVLSQDGIVYTFMIARPSSDQTPLQYFLSNCQ